MIGLRRGMRTTKLSYRLFEYDVTDAVAAHDFADHNYVFQHMSGPHSFLPSFMINFHGVKTKEDALGRADGADRLGSNRL